MRFSLIRLSEPKLMESLQASKRSIQQGGWTLFLTLPNLKVAQRCYHGMCPHVSLQNHKAAHLRYPTTSTTTSVSYRMR